MSFGNSGSLGGVGVQPVDMQPTAIDPKTLYLSAVHSKQVEIKGPEEKVFLIPGDLIYKRSVYVRKVVDWPSEVNGRASIDFTDAPLTTLEDFVVWSYSPQPSINSNASFKDVVELAIFADLYFIEALHNQALDILRQKLGRSEWKLQPDIVERVYSIVHSATPLRRLIRMLLNSTTRSVKYNSSQRSEMDSWATVFEKYAEIGKDYYLANCEGYSPIEVLNGGSCYYHWHKGSNQRGNNHSGGTNCPYYNPACFSDWDESSISEDTTEDSAKTSSSRVLKKRKIGTEET